MLLENEMEEKRNIAKFEPAAAEDQLLFDEKFLMPNEDTVLLGFVILWVLVSLIMYVIFFTDYKEPFDKCLRQFIGFEIIYSIPFVICIVIILVERGKFEDAERLKAEVTIGKIYATYHRNGGLKHYVFLSDVFTGDFSSYTGKNIRIKEKNSALLRQGDKLLLLVEYNGKKTRERLVIPEETQEIIEKRDHKDAFVKQEAIPLLKYWGVAMLSIFLYFAASLLVLYFVRSYVLN